MFVIAPNHLFHVFEALILCHIVAGAVGLVAFWPPVIGRKGGAAHRRFGRVFFWCMLLAGGFATGMSLMTVAAPMETHPHLADHHDFSNPALVRVVFGWLMLHLALLTIDLAWYGRACLTNQADHARHRRPAPVAMQVVLAAAAINTAVQGALVGIPLLGGMAIVGLATAGTNLRFMFRRAPRPGEWLAEHVKGIVGAGISVYTAFFAFGAVRLVPELALTPVLWAVPLTVGLGIILWHRRRIFAPMRQDARKSVLEASS